VAESRLARFQPGKGKGCRLPVPIEKIREAPLLQPDAFRSGLVIADAPRG
jgi:hypothetical protein